VARTCVLFDQCHHMVDIFIEGPDAIKLASHLTINSFANFPVNRAKQFVPCSYDGYVIGDGILFHLDKDSLVFVGRAPTANWIQFHGETGGYNVKITKDDRSPSRPWASPSFASITRTKSKAERRAGDQETQRRAVPDIKFFHHGCHQHRGT